MPCPSQDAELGLDGESFVAEAARKLKLCEAKLRSGLLRRTVVTGRVPGDRQGTGGE